MQKGSLKGSALCLVTLLPEGTPALGKNDRSYKKRKKQQGASIPGKAAFCPETSQESRKGSA